MLCVASGYGWHRDTAGVEIQLASQYGVRAPTFRKEAGGGALAATFTSDFVHIRCACTRDTDIIDGIRTDMACYMYVGTPVVVHDLCGRG